MNPSIIELYYVSPHGVKIVELSRQIKPGERFYEDTHVIYNDTIYTWDGDESDDDKISMCRMDDNLVFRI